MTNASAFSNGIPDLSRTKLRDKIVESLTDMILDSGLKPGDQLPSQQKLTEELGVSRVVLREAVQWLEARGLVEAIQGKGVVIKTPDPVPVLRGMQLLLKRHSATLADLWQIRSLLEPEMAAFAAEEATSEQLEAMEKAVSQMKGQESDISTVIEADMLFHQLLAEASGNIVLRLFWEVLASLIHGSIEETTQVLPGYDHSTVFEAVRNRNPDAAREAMRRHMESSAKHRRKWLQADSQ